MTPLTLHAHRCGRALTLAADGEIDLSNIESFSRALDDAVATDSDAVTVDLAAVDYLDSGAISALFAHADRIRVVANPLLMPVLTISGLAELTAVTSAR